MFAGSRKSMPLDMHSHRADTSLADSVDGFVIVVLNR